ncbi:myb family transcription factor PHL5-like isoform X3 [Malus sylvestris]|uniref:myb family transcription factor PHL5-like isoform X3 n=1 Tax=Malus sylvestris TaxID=3752 RepID=UPI0021ABE114|nr:myb family transcription factor PHL5-like isoform X3 [Malus sylvestris]
MNEKKTDCQEINQQSHELISECNFEVGNQSFQIFGQQQQQAWNNMGIWVQQPTMDHGVSLLQNLGPPDPKSPSSITSRFESLASTFYATERCMGGFPQYDSQVGNNPHFPSGQSYNESYSSMNSSEQTDLDFDIRNTLQSIVKTQPRSYQYHKSSEKFNQIPGSDLSGSKLFAHQSNKLHGDHKTTTIRRPSLSLPSKENQDQGCYTSFNTSPVTQPSFFSQQGKQSPRYSSGNVSTAYGNSPSTSPVLSSKTRIRWNQDLHEKFVECVNRLGGAERKSEKRTTLNLEPHLDVKTGLQIKEALQLQLDVQRRLHEQLEIQRKLRLRIEEQGKQFKEMFDLQQQTSSSLLKTQNADVTCHEAGPSNSLDDTDQVSTSEGSGNTSFHSKIS